VDATSKLIFASNFTPSGFPTTLEPYFMSGDSLHMSSNRVRCLDMGQLTIELSRTPGLTCLRAAHIDLEGLCLDREVRALRDQFVTFNYSKILYNGLYFSPEREFLHTSIIASQTHVNGYVRCRAYKGMFGVLGRGSETEKLYDMSESR